MANLSNSALLALTIAFILVSSSCKNDPQQDATILFSPPDYNKIQVLATTDTIKFALRQDTYNAIKSFNLFIQDQEEFISFYDALSQTINIYHFESKNLIKRVKLKKWFKDKKFYKTTVYAKNFDSIFITNQKKLYLFDSSGKKLNSIEFLDSPDNLYAVFDNTNLPVIKNKYLYAAVRPYVKANSLKALQNWKVIYQFDLSNNSSKLFQHLPKLYQHNYFGLNLVDYNYCFNNKGNFVFSFTVDTNVYESDLVSLYTGHFGKSKFQVSPIEPLKSGDLEDQEQYRQYKLRDIYGPIFFDSYRKRYLRIAKQKITEADFEAKNWERKESIIIFDNEFKIIGESVIDSELSFSTLYLTNNGDIYVRTKVKDEYGLYFVRLTYKESGSFELTKN